MVTHKVTSLQQWLLAIWQWIAAWHRTSSEALLIACAGVHAAGGPLSGLRNSLAGTVAEQLCEQCAAKQPLRLQGALSAVLAACPLAMGLLQTVLLACQCQTSVSREHLGMLCDSLAGHLADSSVSNLGTCGAVGCTREPWPVLQGPCLCCSAELHVRNPLHIWRADVRVCLQMLRVVLLFCFR